MPIMNRMRENMGWIFACLAALFLIMIVFEWGMDLAGLRTGGRGRDVVGTVNGTKITYREFSELLKVYSDNIKEQTGKEPEEDQLQQLRNQVWQSLVSQTLAEQEVKKLGLTVTDQELIHWVRGPNPPEDLRRNFVDSTGAFRQDVYDQFLSNPNQFIRDPQGEDPAYGSRWLANYEKNLRQRRLNEKLQSLILATVRVNEGELRQRFIEQHEKANAEFVFFDVAAVGDNDVQITDADLKAYYDENIDQYKVAATRKLKYVVFVDKPTEADSALRLRDVEEAAKRARSGADFLQLVGTYSDSPDSGTYFHHGELSPKFENAVFSGKVGDLIGPIADGDGYRLSKILEQRKSEKEYIHAEHILVALQGGPDSTVLIREAAQIAREARQGAAFTELKDKYSKEPGSGLQESDMGWFTHGRVSPQIEKAAFGAKIGDVIGPIRTPSGWQVIKVLGRDSRELKLATITAKIEPSVQTKSGNQDRARDFAANARETDFAKEAQQTGLEVHESSLIEKSVVIPGIGMNEMLSRWVFDKKVGEVSDPFSMFSGNAVVTITEAKAAGIRPYEEVKESLRPFVLRKKKVDRAVQLASELKAKLGPSDSLNRVVQIDPSAKLQSTGEFVVGTPAPGVGADAAFLGGVQSLEPGRISAPIRSLRGAYLIQVVSRTAFDSTAYAAQHDALLQRMQQETKSRYLNEWMGKLRETAEIEDHRDQFFH